MQSQAILFGVLSIFLGALGQTLLKQGLLLIEFKLEMLINLKGWFDLLQNGWIPTGILCYALSMVLWIQALSKGELSQLYPLISLNFVILTAVGYLLFHESVGWLRITGVLLIVVGVFLITRS